MEELLSGLPPHREPSGAIRPRLQPSLDRLTDPQVFILYAIPYRDTAFVVGAGFFADIRKVEIKNDAAMVDVNRDHQICVQIPLIAIEHEVWIQPEIPCTVATPGGTHRCIFIGTHHRTRLQAITIL